MQIYEDQWKSKRIYGNLLESKRNVLKIMKITEIMEIFENLLNIKGNQLKIKEIINESSYKSVKIKETSIKNMKIKNTKKSMQVKENLKTIKQY